MNLFYLTYISTRNNSLNQDELDNIVSHAEIKNKIKNITGILFLKDNTIVQYIEGDAVVLFDLFKKIKSDSRHSNITLLNYSKLKKRLFPDWQLKHILFEDLKSDHFSVHHIDKLIQEKSIQINDDFFKEII